MVMMRDIWTILIVKYNKLVKQYVLYSYVFDILFKKMNITQPINTW